MRTIAEVLQMGLNLASKEGISHYCGMCSIIVNMHFHGHITGSEKDAAIHWIDEQLEKLDDELVYLVSWLKEAYNVSDGDELYDLWYGWYVDKITQLNKQP